MLLLSQLKNRIKVVLPLLSDSLADENVLLNKNLSCCYKGNSELE